ncbi:MAG: zinc ribbon domain-containing protein [Trichodesmium sp.]
MDRWFPSSQICSNCFDRVDERLLEVREWTCLHSGTKDDRDGNAAHNIRSEGIKILHLGKT